MAIQQFTLNNLVIEETSPRDKNTNKLFFTYDKSLEAIRNRRFERHLRPSEEFQVLIETIENPKSQYKSIADDMLSSYGEWFSLAMEREDKTTLICYLDPENLVWNPQKNIYEVQGHLKRAEEHKFTIDEKIPSQKYVDLNRFHEDLQVFLYSKPFDQLPDIMKEGSKRAQLYLPPEGVILPCGRCYGVGGFFDVDAYYGSGASRGVRRR